MFGKQTTAFLSYLRLSIYMSIVAVAIVLSFHLRRTASEAELRMAKPLGAVFWALSVSCLGVGLANYTSMSICARLCWNGFFFLSSLFDMAAAITDQTKGTVNKYSRRAAIVQSGWRTQAVSVTPLLASESSDAGRKTTSSMRLTCVAYGCHCDVHHRFLCDITGHQQIE